MKEVKISTNIINKIRPLKVSIEFSQYLPNSCAKRVEKIDLDFNKVNYTTNFYFDSKSNNMNMSIDKDFLYKYEIINYFIEEEEDDLVCIDFLGIQFCESNNCKEPIIINIQEAKEVIIQEKGNTFSIKI